MISCLFSLLLHPVRQVVQPVRTGTNRNKAEIEFNAQDLRSDKMQLILRHAYVKNWKNES